MKLWTNMEKKKLRYKKSDLETEVCTLSRGDLNFRQRRFDSIKRDMIVKIRRNL